MANDQLRVSGGPALVSALKRKQGQFLKTMQTELPAAGQATLAAAQQVVPRKVGELAASAVVSSEVKDNAVRVAVAYTDKKAAAVHEGVHHGHHVEGTHGFKWLEHSFKLEKPKLLADIVKSLKALTGG